jgi:hypothetical protein
MTSDPFARSRLRKVLVAVILLTIPCYCTGLVAVLLAPGGPGHNSGSSTPLPSLTPVVYATQAPTTSFTPLPFIASATPSQTPTFTVTPTTSNTPTITQTPTASLTPTPSNTPFIPPTFTETPRPTITYTFTPLPTYTNTHPPSATYTPLSTSTGTVSPTGSSSSP